MIGSKSTLGYKTKRQRCDCANTINNDFVDYAKAAHKHYTKTQTDKHKIEIEK